MLSKNLHKINQSKKALRHCQSISPAEMAKGGSSKVFFSSNLNYVLFTNPVPHLEEEIGENHPRGATVSRDAIRNTIVYTLF